jgi:hypothetical protein
MQTGSGLPLRQSGSKNSSTGRVLLVADRMTAAAWDLTMSLKNTKIYGVYSFKSLPNLMKLQVKNAQNYQMCAGDRFDRINVSVRWWWWW